MTHAATLGAKIAAISTTFSPYPASFNGNPWLYGMSLASLMAITMFSAIVCGWMMRDIWRDRFNDHPTTPVFLFRLMVAIISFTAFLRCLPEVAYMTCYGEVTGDTMGQILTVKRMADVIALPLVVGWMTILVLVYPFVTLALKAHRQLGIGFVDPLGVWPRLVRPVAILFTILVIASLMAAAKGSMGHGV
jgi:hypothetical protein